MEHSTKSDLIKEAKPYVILNKHQEFFAFSDHIPQELYDRIQREISRGNLSKAELAQASK